ncbi:putative fatty acyl-CoA reductase CG8303 [Phlebotomus argentipes]|uniref:putative fatty acyl-CoA reductase CG8303 n=1 Tax=Phlebotomus argentipes TaxID=94469 RepID=UPI00289363F1|nr:putative fatty acyl-CoA reductase CG8303 [Phlebotomus argentipes]
MVENTVTFAQFFAGKNIFVTGGTGFLGSVLIESLLRVSPDIGQIYVLVRDKNGSLADKRIQRMLSKPLFKNHSSAAFKKIVPVVGELTAENLDFSSSVLHDITKNVNIIFHSAATIKFNSQLKTAIDINVLGTLRTIELAKRLDNLAAYVYFSTAFCNSNNRGLILEKVYPSHKDPYEMMRLATEPHLLPDISDCEGVKEIIGQHPNTYTFTKQMAENLIVREMAGLPVALIRPSVVYGTYEHPVQGWVGNANSGHLGFLAGYVKGVFRTMTGNPSSVIAIIPCDYVINSTLAMAWYVGTRKIAQPEVIHCTSTHEENPITLKELCDIFNRSAALHPCDKFLWKPHCQLRNSFRYTIFFYLFHILPAMVVWIPEKITGLGIRRMSVLDAMRVFDRGTKAFDYFMNQDFRYSVQNSLRIMRTMSDEDAQRYCFDAARCDWSELIARCFKGLRLYYFKESANTTLKHRVIRKV